MAGVLTWEVPVSPPAWDFFFSQALYEPGQQKLKLRAQSLATGSPNRNLAPKPPESGQSHACCKKPRDWPAELNRPFRLQRASAAVLILYMVLILKRTSIPGITSISAGISSIPSIPSIPSITSIPSIPSIPSIICNVLATRNCLTKQKHKHMAQIHLRHPLHQLRTLPGLRVSTIPQ